MSEVGVEIVKTEETEKNKIKYLNINVSNSEVERKPDIVRLCADAGILEYVKPKIGHWIRVTDKTGHFLIWECDKCGLQSRFSTDFCHDCGCRMVEPQESEDKCKNCKYYHNPDYTRCHKCKAESEISE